MINFYRFNIGQKCNYCKQKEMLIASKKHSKFLLISKRTDLIQTTAPWTKINGKGVCIHGGRQC